MPGQPAKAKVMMPWLATTSNDASKQMRSGLNTGANAKYAFLKKIAQNANKDMGDLNREGDKTRGIVLETRRREDQNVYSSTSHDDDITGGAQRTRGKSGKGGNGESLFKAGMDYNSFMSQAIESSNRVAVAQPTMRPRDHRHAVEKRTIYIPKAEDIFQQQLDADEQAQADTGVSRANRVLKAKLSLPLLSTTVKRKQQEARARWGNLREGSRYAVETMQETSAIASHRWGQLRQQGVKPTSTSDTEDEPAPFSRPSFRSAPGLSLNDPLNTLYVAFEQRRERAQSERHMTVALAGKGAVRAIQAEKSAAKKAAYAKVCSRVEQRELVANISQHFGIPSDKELADMPPFEAVKVLRECQQRIVEQLDGKQHGAAGRMQEFEGMLTKKDFAQPVSRRASAAGEVDVPKRKQVPLVLFGTQDAQPQPKDTTNDFLSNKTWLDEAFKLLTAKRALIDPSLSEAMDNLSSEVEHERLRMVISQRNLDATEVTERRKLAALDQEFQKTGETSLSPVSARSPHKRRPRR